MTPHADSDLYVPREDQELYTRDAGQHVLQQQAFAHHASQMVHCLRQGGRIAIQGDWGSGKTTVLGLIHDEMKEVGTVSILINAWESSYASDPLIAVMSSVTRALRDEHTVAPIVDTLREKVSRAATLGARRLVGGVLHAATAGAVAHEDVTEILSALQQPQSTIDNLDALQAHEDLGTALSEVRDALGSIASTIDGPLVLLVDELDRCTPDYALQFLERSIHVFNAQQVVIVFAMDVEQVKNMVLTRYGNHARAAAYLQRFFDISLALPATSFESAGFMQSALQATGLAQSLRLDVWDRGDPYAQVLLPLIPNALGLSLRQQLQLLTWLQWVHEHTDLQTLPNAYLVCLYFLKSASYRHAEFVEAALQGTLQADDVIAVLRDRDPHLQLLQIPQASYFLASFVRALCPELSHSVLEAVVTVVGTTSDFEPERFKSSFERSDLRRSNRLIGQFRDHLGCVSRQ